MPSWDLKLEFVRLLTDPDDPMRACCPSCQEHLAVHQPDVERPERLLGACSECRVWYLIDARAAVMARLPHWDALLGCWQSSPPGEACSAHPDR